MYSSPKLAFARLFMAISPAVSQNMFTILGRPENNWSHQTMISFPGNEAFFNATDRWDIFAPPTYKAAISPATEADVVTTVKLAKDFRIPFLATGGRHGYGTTLAKLQNGLAVDLSKMNKILVNKSAATLTVGPGVIFRDIFDPVYNAGFQVPTGTCSCVGMMGATVGAGIGRLNGLNGLMIDALISVRIVTANGEVLEASETQNAELFWGIRGAGANFGILTAATYKLEPLYKGGAWTTADVIIPGPMNGSYFNALALLEIVPELTATTIMIWNATIGEPSLLVSLVYAGPLEEGKKAIASILDLNPPYVDLKEITWKTLYSDSAFGLDTPLCQKGQIYDIYALNLLNLSAPTFKESFNKITQFWRAEPLAQPSVIILETFPNQGVRARPDNSTAYPWRNAATYVMVQMRWDVSGGSVAPRAAAMGKELRSDLVATSGYDDLTVYVNYAHGDETLEQIYGASKLPRLAALKQRFDPKNTFGFSNALPSSYP